MPNPSSSFPSSPMLMSLFLAVMLVVVLERSATVTADIASDQSKCADELMTLATCLQYVSGSSKMPTPDCCAGMKKVLGQSPKCLCLLIKDRDDPSIGVKIDPTRAMSLPSDCNTPASISHCPKLLNLPPNSPDAKIFTDFGGASHGNSSTATGSNSTANLTTAMNTTSNSSPTVSNSVASNGGRSNYYYHGNGGLKSWWLEVELVGGLLAYHYCFLGSVLQ